MLNENNERELAYIVKVDSVIPHPNADRLEIAKVNGWNVIVGKGEFNQGDNAVYFEIDSLLPAEEPFSDMAFLVSKYYEVRTQKIRGEYSQGLLIPISAFEGTKFEQAVKTEKYLTTALNVTYRLKEDRIRKATSALNVTYRLKEDRIRKATSAKPNKKKNFFDIFNFKKSKKFPTHFQYIKKTDEERIENLPNLWGYREPLIMTEKLDGTSATYILEKKLFGYEFYVLSRNIRQFRPSL